MTPFVSIITPSFNQGEYIEETINSVINQDYPNFEHIVVDGGSTDNTLDVLKKYGHNIRWLSEKDKGQADAIDKGIRMAKGEIVSWLNSDDILLPGALKEVVGGFERCPDVKMIYGKAYFIDTSGENIGRYPTEPFDFQRLAMFNFICQPSTFFKREDYHDIGGLDLELSYSLDYDLWIRIADKFQVAYLPVWLSGYRLHVESKTVAYRHALQNHQEGLRTALKHYNWAPANRVYGYYYHVVESKIGERYKVGRPLTIAVALFISLIKYLQLNKYVRAADIRALNMKNLRKLATEWKDLYKTY